MAAPLDFINLTPAHEIVGDDAEETSLLRQMLTAAREYIESFPWCPPIDAVYYGDGVAGVIAVFLFHFTRPIGGSDEWLWVVEGDLPSAYLVLDDAPDPSAALETYSELMEGWAASVLKGQPLHEVFPVQAAPVAENAHDLLNRVQFVRTELLPRWRAKWARKVPRPR